MELSKEQFLQIIDEILKGKKTQSKLMTLPLSLVKVR